MNDQPKFSSLETAIRLETAGLSRPVAQAVAHELEQGMMQLVTKRDLETALLRHTIAIGSIIAAVAAIATAFLK